MSESYSKTHVILPDGTTRSAGQTIRTSEDAFSDSVILGFTAPDRHGKVYVKLARPHCMATCIGTTSPGVALMVETYECPLDYLMKDRVVDKRSRVSGFHETDPANRPYADEKIDLRVTA